MLIHFQSANWAVLIEKQHQQHHYTGRDYGKDESDCLDNLSSLYPSEIRACNTSEYLIPCQAGVEGGVYLARDGGHWSWPTDDHWQGSKTGP